MAHHIPPPPPGPPGFPAASGNDWPPLMDPMDGEPIIHTVDVGRAPTPMVEFSGQDFNQPNNSVNKKKNGKGAKLLEPVETRYEGFVLEKAPPLRSGAQPTWARVSKREMPFDSNKLLGLVKEHRRKTRSGPANDFNQCGPKQQGVINRLIAERKRDDKNPNADWVLVDVQRSVIRRFGVPSETTRMQVILKRQDKNETRTGDPKSVSGTNGYQDTEIIDLAHPMPAKKNQANSSGVLDGDNNAKPKKQKSNNQNHRDNFHDQQNFNPQDEITGILGNPTGLGIPQFEQQQMHGHNDHHRHHRHNSGQGPPMPPPPGFGDTPDILGIPGDVPPPPPHNIPGAPHHGFPPAQPYERNPFEPNAGLINPEQFSSQVMDDDFDHQPRARVRTRPSTPARIPSRSAMRASHGQEELRQLIPDLRDAVREVRELRDQGPEDVRRKFERWNISDSSNTGGSADSLFDQEAGAYSTSASSFSDMPRDFPRDSLHDDRRRKSVGRSSPRRRSVSRDRYRERGSYHFGRREHDRRRDPLYRDDRPRRYSDEYEIQPAISYPRERRYSPDASRPRYVAQPPRLHRSYTVDDYPEGMMAEAVPYQPPRIQRRVTDFPQAGFDPAEFIGDRFRRQQRDARRRNAFDPELDQAYEKGRRDGMRRRHSAYVDMRYS
jgi:hypothetical protein